MVLLPGQAPEPVGLACHRVLQHQLPPRSRFEEIEPAVVATTVLPAMPLGDDISLATERDGVAGQRHHYAQGSRCAVGTEGYEVATLEATAVELVHDNIVAAVYTAAKRDRRLIDAKHIEAEKQHQRHRCRHDDKRVPYLPHCVVVCSDAASHLLPAFGEEMRRGA